MTTLGKAPHDRLFVASVTPWTDDGELDEAGFRALLRYFVSSSDAVDDFGIIVNPEAGEVFYLSPDERAHVVEVALDEVGGQLPLWTGLLANSTRDMVALAERLTAIEVKGHRVGGLFVMPPIGALDLTIAWDADRYPEVWQDMLAEVAAALPDVPLICHPVAAPTPAYGIGLPVEATVSILNAIPQITDWKMTYSYEGYRRISRALRGLDRHVGVLGATAVNFHENLASGTFDGTVTGSFNYALEPMLDHLRAWRDGDHACALKIWDDGLAQLHEYVYSEWGRLHVRYKTATWLRGVIATPWMRAPMPKPRREEVVKLRDLLAGAGLAVIDQQHVDEVVSQLVA